MSIDTQPQNELDAKDFVQGVGVDRALRLLTAIVKRIDRRIQRANDRSGYSVGLDYTTVITFAWESELIYKIKIGVSLLCTDTPEKAHERNVKRRATRLAARRASRDIQVA